MSHRIAEFITGESAAGVAQVKSGGRHKEETADTQEKLLISFTYALFGRL